MSQFSKVIAVTALCVYGTKGICGPAPLPVASERMPLPTMVSVMMWHKVRLLHSGMTPEQAMRTGPFLPLMPKEKRPAGWCTLLYCGPVTPAETKKLNGKVIAVDVQLVRHAGPVSAFNPAGGSLNPTSGETIAMVSAPYLSDGGAVNLD